MFIIHIFLDSYSKTTIIWFLNIYKIRAKLFFWSIMENPLEVKLSGFNVDIDGLKEIKKLLEQESLSEEDRKTALDILDNLTPETISASAARISRDPRPINELRKEARADVKKARESNKAIIFTSGHKSIAEHAFFNFDIMGVSRRAVEELERPRLQSYTEKSQRYITMKGDFMIPKEIQASFLEPKFVELIELQNNFYNNNRKKITDWHHKQDYSDLFESLGYTDKPEKQIDTIEGLGKEDARYSLAQATQAQLELSASARNLEVLITRLRSSDVEEFKDLGEKIFKEVDGIAPSVIKYTEPVDYFSKTRPELRKHVADLIKKYKSEVRQYTDDDNDDVRLFTNLDRDDSIPAALIFSSSNLPYYTCLSLVDCINSEEKEQLVNQTIKYREKHDPMLREYELGDRVAQFIISASGFAQLKRHRMNTLISQDYLTELGHTTPESIILTGLEDELAEIIKKSNELHDKLLKCDFPKAVAEYALTNANKRRVLFDANNRQVHAIYMERENLAAQWDIRRLINQYGDLIQDESPLTARGLCGKHEFYDVKKRLLNEG